MKKIETTKKRTRKKEVEKETRGYKVSYSKRTDGSFTGKVTFPLEWLEHMGINPNDRNIEVTYRPRTKTLTIKKKSLEVAEDKED